MSANEKAEKKNKVEDAASKQVSATRQEIRRQWNDLQKQIHEPGKMHKLKRIALAQLPVHPQYIDAGTSFNADLVRPLDFGTEAVKPEALTSIGSAPPNGSVVHARLLTALNSSTAKKEDPVEALITEPLVVSDHLILPEGSVIKGSVVQAQPARRLRRNGQLRILFHQVAPPNGLEQKVETNLEGVAVAKDEHLKLDAEGGAQVTTPRTRYLTTGIQVMLAATQAARRGQRGRSGRQRGEWRVGIPVCRNDCGIGGAFTSSIGGIRFVWRSDVDLLPLSGARTRCRLSERHGHGDRARNSG